MNRPDKWTGLQHEHERFGPQHEKGTGARLLAVLKENGIGWQLVRVWKGADRSEESRMKKCHNRTLLCPICGGERREARRISQKA